MHGEYTDGFMCRLGAFFCDATLLRNLTPGCQSQNIGFPSIIRAWWSASLRLQEGQKADSRPGFQYGHEHDRMKPLWQGSTSRPLQEFGAGGIQDLESRVSRPSSRSILGPPHKCGFDLFVEVKVMSSSV